MNGLGGCGCGKIESLGSYSGFVPGSTGAFGVNPDGLGATLAQVAPTTALIYLGAGAAGYFVGGKKHRVAGALAGLAAAFVMGIAAATRGGA
jgi:hypothetical protein